MYPLIATIEVERHRRADPGLPPQLHDAYRAALTRAKEPALADLATATDPVLVRSAMAVVAVGGGNLKLGAPSSSTGPKPVEAHP